MATSKKTQTLSQMDKTDPKRAARIRRAMKLSKDKSEMTRRAGEFLPGRLQDVRRDIEKRKKQIKKAYDGY